MHSPIALSRHDPRTAGPRRRLTGRSGLITAAWRPGRRGLARPVSLRASREPGPLGPGRVPEEGYRDYLFRQDVWS
jgi:hypothetical protein